MNLVVAMVNTFNWSNNELHFRKFGADLSHSVLRSLYKAVTLSIFADFTAMTFVYCWFEVYFVEQFNAQRIDSAL